MLAAYRFGSVMLFTFTLLMLFSFATGERLPANIMGLLCCTICVTQAMFYTDAAEAEQ